MTVRADNVANEFLIESKESTPSLRAYLLLLFLTSINILNFTGRLLPTSLGLQIQQDIKIGHGALGLLSGTYFVLTYTFASLLFGVLADP